MQLDYLIFDVDDTLLDFREAYYSAQHALARILQAPFDSEFVKTDEELSWKNWKALQLDKTDLPIVQKNYHVYYKQYLELHYKTLGDVFGSSVSTGELIACYQNAIASSRKPVEPDTENVYAGLSRDYKLAIATNGIGWIQRARVQDFMPFTSGVFISEEMGVVKPAKAFYEIVLDQLGCSPDRCLMVGDSLSNDIVGAKSAGLFTCWYNHKRKPSPEGMYADYAIENIGEINGILSSFAVGKT